MTALWTSDELRAATGGTLAAEVSVTGISIDTRSLAPGDLFVALRDARDGHDFVADALAKGAAAALVDSDPPGVAPDAPLLRVTETLAGLTALGAAGRARSAARVVGVTGSVGKTTTKEMLRVALSAFGPTHASAASFNNHWGVPITLARMPRDAAFAVIEMGMNQRGEIAPLTRLARPHVGVITTTGTAHIGNLGSEEAIAEEKGDILLGIEAGGTLVIPADSRFAARLAARGEEAGLAVLAHGEAPGADARLLAYEGTEDGGRAEILLRGERIGVMLAAPGRHVALNACAVLAAVAALGLSPRTAAAALPAFGAPAGRGRRTRITVSGGEALLIDDSYNASPPSIRAGLAVLAAQAATRRIAALGDMRELGDEAPAIHASLAPDAAQSCDLVFCCGEMMGHLYRALPEGRRGAHLPDSASLAPVLKQALRPGDAVLVKGSLGSRMAVVVEALTEGMRP
ncbi:UDP-N-acetylmuramoyl-tripeptide--D-alanyl-D-alanine ligase [Neoroseomonas oryzicola]|uniref:UDP-N-acetylmuramoyl-tripeptide--D-alanyl-D-alanine ligase n=1 Tax=Neoroseomonas oryzicola TaxID=535904 RepID=A0A9X9WLR4_9PROT|nr:UDP-N-acetylmuramoyl-tripeptide--D-alanyl-D-alanine ligase [Neoroseomonas oryzicola]NKE16528.1 UDP-N-acetylmuramoyl-tripeptide--D-alanyl-D-alanine ligase [Neoroseomonas oryzicola]